MSTYLATSTESPTSNKLFINNGTNQILCQAFTKSMKMMREKYIT